MTSGFGFGSTETTSLWSSRTGNFLTFTFVDMTFEYPLHGEVNSDDKNGQTKKSLLKYVDGKGKKTTQGSKAGSQENFSRERSGAETRARTREKTKEKTRVKKLDDCCQIELQNDDKDISWECIMDQETSKQA
ncbi:hypothetical protein L1987_85598 [Smallanthus sonchifolius]|uniref:Uncharacterized protein n=1 Tax=Smallanthus sonchifolius TaxID=185202 RepID=A0ACB8XWX6_9ASTR|nr:hypothetical protein L1987_85598 [Smallanthus sonchifolius]